MPRIISWLRAVTSCCHCEVARQPANSDYKEFTVPGQEIVWHITPIKLQRVVFNTLVFARIKETRYNVLISSLSLRARLVVSPSC